MTTTYNPYLVLLSAFIAVLASYVALELASRVTISRGFSRRLWLFGGAIAMGTGIWSMHFIAMLAFSIPLFISYNLTIVLVSLLAAILASIQALYTISRPAPKKRTLIFSSCFMGMGIATMHYVGMAAMQMPANLSYNPVLFVLSAIIAIGVSFAALTISIQFRQRGGRRRFRLKLTSAVSMGSAIMLMHYTGMAAAIFKPNPSRLVAAPGLDNLSLAYLVCLLTLFTLGIALSAMYVEFRSGNPPHNLMRGSG
jgi:NO-binding membrane sensor protein with MHYT domain